jgi:hypothetical protein
MFVQDRVAFLRRCRVRCDLFGEKLIGESIDFHT